MKKSSNVSNLYRGASLCCINSFHYDLYLGMFFYEWYVEWALSGGLAHYQCVFAAAVLCYWRTGHSLAQGKQNTGESILGPSFLLRLTCPESQECLWGQIDGAKLPFTGYDGGHRQEYLTHNHSTYFVTNQRIPCHSHVAHKFLTTQIVDGQATHKILSE